MVSTKRYYTLREAAESLGIPLHQARRWVKQFLPGSRQGRIRLSQKDLEQLRLIYRGFYVHRLRGRALRAFIQTAPVTACGYEPYAILRELRERLKAIEARLEGFLLVE